MPTKSKFFRVATEGATTDGRVIDRLWIEQAAKNFKPEKYGARVWLEHIRGVVPGSPFDALGDVTAVEARAVEDGKLALFAQIAPLPALIQLNKTGQKLYTSCELAPRFADTGEAYLMGLAVTDSPASLGTEILKFAAAAGAGNPFAARKSAPDALFTEAVPLLLEFDDGATSASAPASEGSALGKLIDLFTRMLPGAASAPHTPNAHTRAVSAQTQGAAATPSTTAASPPDPALTAALTQMGVVLQAFAATQTAQQAQIDALTTQLAQTPASAGRPTATGGSGLQLADC